MITEKETYFKTKNACQFNNNSTGCLRGKSAPNRRVSAYDNRKKKLRRNVKVAAALWRNNMDLKIFRIFIEETVAVASKPS